MSLAGVDAISGTNAADVHRRPRVETSSAWLEWLCWGQGLYCLATGLWPLISIQSFQWVTGPKTDHLPTGREADHWLVMTVGVLVTAIALSLLTAAWRRSIQVETIVLALGIAIGLTGIDLVYVARGVIAPIYLVDAAIEVGLILGWVIGLVVPFRNRNLHAFE